MSERLLLLSLLGVTQTYLKPVAAWCLTAERRRHCRSVLTSQQELLSLRPLDQLPAAALVVELHQTWHEARRWWDAMVG